MTMGWQVNCCSTFNAPSNKSVVAVDLVEKSKVIWYSHPDPYSFTFWMWMMEVVKDDSHTPPAECKNMLFNEFWVNRNIKDVSGDAIHYVDDCHA
jgi:hypothetical protein